LSQRFLAHPWPLMKPFAIRDALPRGRAERIPQRKTPFASSPGFPRKALSPWLAPRGGAGSARPQGWHDANPKIAPSWPPASPKGIGGNAIPCHSSGRPMRTHRVRPSEKTDLYVIPGFSPKGLSARLAPAEGRPPHARKDGMTLTPTLPLLGHRLLGKASVATQSLAIRPAVPCGRTECVPPRKPPPALSQGFHRKALSPSLAPRGGAGSARPLAESCLYRGITPLGHQTFVCPR